jgi:hypothetical protein
MDATSTHRWTSQIGFRTQWPPIQDAIHHHQGRKRKASDAMIVSSNAKESEKQMVQLIVPSASGK